MNIIAIANQKDGVGKTTTTLNLGVGLAELGRRVLLVDLDPQARLTQSLLPDFNGPSMADVMGGEHTGKVLLSQIVRQVSERLYLAPSDLALSLTELNLFGRLGKENILKKALAGLTFNVCLIDCGPSLGLLTVNALAAADGVICPTLPSALDLRGVRLFIESLGAIRAELNPSLELVGLLVSQYDKNSPSHREALETLQASRLPVLSVIDKSSEVVQSIGAVNSAAGGTLPSQYRQLSEVVNHWQRNLQG